MWEKMKRGRMGGDRHGHAHLAETGRTSMYLFGMYGSRDGTGTQYEIALEVSLGNAGAVSDSGK